MIVVVVLALLPFVFAAVSLRRAYAAVAVNDVSAVIKGGRLDDTPSVRLLIDRSLSRGRRFRTTSSVVAWVGVVAVVVARSVSGAAQFDISLAGLVVAGLCGYLGGAILGETHQLRRPRGVVRVASVSPRPVRGYRTRQLHRMMIGGVAIGIFVAGASVVIGNVAGVNDGHYSWFIVLAVTAVGVAAIVTSMQHRVAWRARPALPEALARADDALRRRAFATLDAAGGALVWMLVCVLLGRVWGVTDGSLARVASALGSIFAGYMAWVLAFAARRVAWPARR